MSKHTDGHNDGHSGGQSEERKPMTGQCWVVTTGTPGTQNQGLGLAEAIGRHVPLDIHVKQIIIEKPWTWLPGGLWPNPLNRLSQLGHLLRPPFPDLWIAAGRRTVPLTIAIGRQLENIFTVQTQDPRAPEGLFDAIIAPTHDRCDGANVCKIEGAPTRVTKDEIIVQAREIAHRFGDLPKPIAVVMIGGPTKTLRLGSKETTRLIEQLQGLRKDGVGLIISNSRRTPDASWHAFKAAFNNDHGVAFIDAMESTYDQGAYPGVLGLADFILVSEDSVNMTCEAVATGMPVYTVPLSGNAGKLSKFHKNLQNRGISRVFEGSLDRWDYEPLDETDRAAQFILQKWQEKAPEFGF